MVDSAEIEVYLDEAVVMDLMVIMLMVFIAVILTDLMGLMENIVMDLFKFMVFI